MNALYPFKFKPVFKEKIWGGNNLKDTYGFNYAPLSNCGEAWLLSGYEGAETEVINGFLAENTVNELIEVYMGDLVGEKNYEKFGNVFPLLVKAIDTNDWLSIQVHPDDKLAQSRHASTGKTEMWYVAAAAKDAELICGFNKELDRELYQKVLSEGNLKDVLNYVHVHVGDVFDIPAGRVHALGKGLTVFEIQQTSDITYRIYDFDRKDKNAQLRELHTELAIDAINFKDLHTGEVDYTLVMNHTIPLIKNEYFTTSLVKFDTQMVKDYGSLDSFVIWQCVNGSCIVKYEGGSEKLSVGEALLIPAVMETVTAVPTSICELLEVYV